MDINSNLIFILFSAISFVVYGINSFFSKRMVVEYERWGFKNQRVILGTCQVLGGLGLLVGLVIPLLLSVTSFLLMCMMLAAVFVRIQLKEKVIQMLPALLYVAVNLMIFYQSVV
tara:strand:- start:452 stop:796 length:345 start_codon:yes stop_codon:yes gene_type:complete